MATVMPFQPNEPALQKSRGPSRSRTKIAGLYQKHPAALVESSRIGSRTRVWAFAHILPSARIGEDCNICDHVFIENDVSIGDRVTIKCGVQLWDGARVEDDVFIGPNVTFTNDPHPRSKHYLRHYEPTVLKKGCSIGANATILPGITVGQSAMVGAGAVVTRNVPAFAMVTGNPARISGYVNADEPAWQGATLRSKKIQHGKIIGAAAAIYRMPIITDLRGSICVGEIESDLPFVPRRYFIVFDVPGKEVRGEHAHKRCHQLLVCVKGSVSVLVDDGEHREEIVLNSPTVAIHIPPMLWTVQYKHSDDAMLLVFASEKYDPSDYIRKYDDFLKALGGARTETRSAKPGKSRLVAAAAKFA